MNELAPELARELARRGITVPIDSVRHAELPAPANEAQADGEHEHELELRIHAAQLHERGLLYRRGTGRVAVVRR